MAAAISHNAHIIYYNTPKPKRIVQMLYLSCICFVREAREVLVDLYIYLRLFFSVNCRTSVVLVFILRRPVSRGSFITSKYIHLLCMNYMTRCCRSLRRDDLEHVARATEPLQTPSRIVKLRGKHHE